MRRNALALLTLLLASVCYGQQYTPNIGLQTPPIGSFEWGGPLNYNFTKLDTLLSGKASLPGLNVMSLTTWQTSVTYGSGAVIFYNGLIYSSLAGGNVGNLPTNTSFWVQGVNGSGTITTGGPYNNTGFTNGSAGAAVGPITNGFTMPVGLTAAQQVTFFNNTSYSDITIQNGDFNNYNGWTNTTNRVKNYKFNIYAQTAMFGWNVQESNAVCDMVEMNGAVTQGSNVLTQTNGPLAFTAADAGDPTTHLGAKWVELAAPVSGVQTIWDAKIIGFISSSQVQLDSNSPFTVSNWSFDYGHDDSTPITNAMNLVRGSKINLVFPVGNCWTNTLKLEGQSLSGQSRLASAIIGKAAHSVISADDPTNGGFIATGNPGQVISDLTIGFSARVDSTLPYNVDTSGTTVAGNKVYKPWGIFTSLMNNPCGWGWIQNCLNGVAYVGSGNGGSSSSVVCVPSGIPLPPLSQIIIFPYQATGTAIFQTTVASYSGTCTSGSPVTLAAAYTGPSNAQGEWFTGTSFQTIQTSIPATGRTFPMIVKLSNPINPTYLNNVENNLETIKSNVAPFGLIQVGAEQCTYFGSSIYPASSTSTPSITLTACSQNGTTAALHNVGDIPIPLNAYKPTWPWPVFNSSGASLNGATSTPVNAAWFAPLSIGVSGLEFPNYNGADYNGGESLANAHVYNLNIQAWPTLVFASENGDGYQTQNSTNCIYAVALPFNTTFDNINCDNSQMGIIEGAPSINPGAYFSRGFPTADGNYWRSIAIHSAGFPFDFVGGGSNRYDGFVTFSSNGGTVGPYNFPAAATYSGGLTQWFWSGVWGDTVSPGFIGGSSGNKYLSSNNFYMELENGTTSGLLPIFEFGCLQVCDWWVNPNGGGTGFITGSYNTFHGAFPNQDATIPIVNFGLDTRILDTAGLQVQQVSNIWGLGTYINWGFGGYCSSTAHGNGGGIGPANNCALGGAAPVVGQTASGFSFGNDGPNIEVSEDSAFIWPYEYNMSGSFEANPAFGLAHDDAIAPTYSSISCNVGTGANSCQSWQFNGGNRKYIGPGQAIASRKMIAHFAFETPAGANTFNVSLQAKSPGAGCTESTVSSQTITTTGSGWQFFDSGATPVDFTSSAGCILQVTLQNASSAAIVKTGYVVLTPYWTKINAQLVQAGQININGTSISSGSGVPTGCGTTYPNGSLYLNLTGTTGSLFYGCIGTTWTDIK